MSLHWLISFAACSLIWLTWKVEQILLKHAQNNGFFFSLFNCLYIIESFKKIREIAGFIPNLLRFQEKN